MIRYVIVATLLIGFSACATCGAQTPSVAAQPELLYRRDYVPKNLLDRDAKGLIPIKRSEFDALLELAQAQRDDRVPHAWLNSAALTASIQDGEIAGKAVITVELRGKGPIALELPRFRFAATNAVWQEESLPRANIGISENGVSYLNVDRSGTVHFDWRLPARRSPWGDFTFDLPPLDASFVSFAMLLEKDAVLESIGLDATSFPEIDGHTRWQVALQPAKEARLRVIPPGNDVHRAYVLVRENSSCRVDVKELQLQSTYRLDVHRQPLTQLELTFPSTWQPTEVRQGDKLVSLEILGTANDTTTALIRFDPPLEGANRRLTVTGNMPLSPYDILSIPRLQLLHTHWLEGHLSLQTSNVWHTHDWHVEHAEAETATQPTAAASEVSWRLLSPAAAFRFQVQEPPHRLRAECGTTLRIADNALSARVVADVTAVAGKAQELSARIAHSWVIDSVEIPSTSTLQSWEVVTDDGNQTLRLRLRQPLQSSERARITVAMHGLFSAAEGLPGQQLAPLQWHVSETAGQVGVIVDPRWQPELVGIETPPVSIEKLSSAEKDRLQNAEQFSLLLPMQSLPGLRLKLIEQSPTFTARWDTSLRASGERISQHVQLRVEPESTVVERLRVLIRPGGGKDITWHVDEADTAGITARLIDVNASAAEEEWELELRRPRRTAFSLTALITSDTRGRYAVPFFRCVEARQQTARIRLLATPTAYLVVERQQGLDAQWPREDAVDSSGARQARTTACWNYDPSQNTSFMVRPATSGELLQLVQLESVTLHTTVAENAYRHQAMHQLRCTQSQTLTFKLPENAVFESATINGEFLPAKLADRAVTVFVVGEQTTQTLTLRYRTSRNHRLPWQTIHAAFPEPPVVAAQQKWQVEIPDRYRVLFSHRLAERSAGWLPRVAALQGSIPLFDNSRSSDEPDHVRGGRILCFEQPADYARPILVVSSSLLAGASWLGMLLAFVSLTWGPWRARSVLAAGIILAALALATPFEFDPLARMILLGAVAGCLGRLARHTIFSSHQGAKFGPASPARAYHWLLFAAAATAVLTKVNVLADDTLPVRRSPIYRVVIPVDAAGVELRDYVYLDERLLASLDRLKSKPRVGPSYLYLDASYRATSSSDSLLDRFEAQFTVLTFDTGVTIRVPWLRSEMAVTGDRVRVGEKVVPIRWATDDTAFTFTSPSKGELRIAVQGKTVNGENAQSGQWNLRLPLTVNSELTIDATAHLSDVRISPSLFKPSVDQSNNERRFELANTSAVRLWLQRKPPTEIQPVAAEQLLWLHRWPAATLVEGRWRFRAASEPLTAAEIEFGTGLELVSATTSAPASLSWKPGIDGSTLHCLPRDELGEIVIEGIFLWSPAIANAHELPRIEPRSNNVTKRWLAIDFDAGTTSSLTSTAAARPLETPSFAAVWNADALPAVAWQFEHSEPIKFASPDDLTQLTYSTETQLTVESDTAQFHFSTHFQQTPPSIDALQIQLPANATVVSAELGVAGQYRSVSWLTLENNCLQLILPAPLQPSHTLRIVGDLVWSSDGNQEFALPRWEKGSAQKQAVEFVVDPTVDAQLTSSAGWDSVATVFSPQSRTSLLARQPNGSELMINWEMHANVPRTVGILTTTLRRDGPQWFARLDAFLAVRGGHPDSFVFEGGTAWQAARLVSKDATLVNTAAGGNRLLRILPTNPQQERFHFAAEAKLTGTSQRAVELPAVRLLGADRTQSFVRLPRTDALDWSASGLQEASLPSSLDLADGDYATYRVIVPQYAARLNSLQNKAATPQIRENSVAMQRIDNDQYWATAAFIALPEGNVALPLRLPLQSQLVHVQINGTPVVATLGAQRALQIPLLSGQLPQMVEVSYVGPVAEAGAPSQLAPAIDGWEVPTEWQVDVAATNLANRPVDPATVAANLSVAIKQSSDEIRETTWAASWLDQIRHAIETPPSHEASTGADRLRILEQLDGQLAPLANDGASMGDSETPTPVATTSSYENLSPALPLVQTLILWLASATVLSLFAWLASLTLKPVAISRWIQRWPCLTVAFAALPLAVLVSPWWIAGCIMAAAAASSLVWPWRVQSLR